MLREKILQSKSGIITYGITPPKKNNTVEKINEITQKHIERLKLLSIDGLIIYDIQDEADRTNEERAFPYLETIDSDEYSKHYLNDVKIPKIVYRCVGKYTREQFAKWLSSEDTEAKLTVFVGASSTKQHVEMKLSEAYEVGKNADIILGGVAIPERHMKNNSEHLRLISKKSQGCKFFVSQAVYNLEASKNFLSDYYYYCKNNNIDMVPILFTLTPCGSTKTLEFMKWLGINIPRWLENDLLYSEDILDKSIEILKKQFKELLKFSLDKKIPIGCNIESISVRKVEIEASIKLVNEIRYIMRDLL